MRPYREKRRKRATAPKMPPASPIPGPYQKSRLRKYFRVQGDTFGAGLKYPWSGCGMYRPRRPEAIGETAESSVLNAVTDANP